MNSRLLAAFTRKNLINIIMVFVCSFFTILYCRNVHNLTSVSGFFSYFTYIFKYVPITVVTALCGIVPGMWTLLIVFIYRCFLSSGFSYLTFIYLLIACAVQILTIKGFFKKWYKTLMASIILQFIAGDFWGMLLMLLGGRDMADIRLSNSWEFFFSEAPACLICCFFVFILFKHIPDEHKKLFGNGKYYIDIEKL